MRLGLLTLNLCLFFFLGRYIGITLGDYSYSFISQNPTQTLAHTNDISANN